MELRWRALTDGDTAAMSRTYCAAVMADGSNELRSAADMGEIFERERIGGVPRRYFGAFAREGLAGYAILFARTELLPEHRMNLWGAVHPAHRRRGIGGGLVGRALAAAPALHAEVFPGAPLEVQLAATDSVAGQAALARAWEFEPWRRHLSMSLDLRAGAGGGIPEAAVPEGMRVVPYERFMQDALLDAHDAAYVADHPGATSMSPDMWARRLAAVNFLPGLSLLMIDRRADAIAGFVLCDKSPNRPDLPGRRNVSLTSIATRREYRRRGVAGALIAQTLREAARGGFHSASLAVDADNPSGAVRVYERAGFDVAGRSTLYLRRLPAGRSAA